MTLVLMQTGHHVLVASAAVRGSILARRPSFPLAPQSPAALPRSRGRRRVGRRRRRPLRHPSPSPRPPRSLSGSRPEPSGPGPQPLTLQQEIHRWVQIHFANCRLSPSTGRRRMVTIAAAMASDPGDSLPKLFPKLYDLQADYRILDAPEATTDNRQAGRRQVVHTCTKSCLKTSLRRGGQGWTDENSLRRSCFPSLQFCYAVPSGRFSGIFVGRNRTGGKRHGGFSGIFISPGQGG
jgi:hypothetical protein